MPIAIVRRKTGMLRKGFKPNTKPGRSSRKRGYPMIEPKEKKWPPTEVGGHFFPGSARSQTVRPASAVVPLYVGSFCCTAAQDPGWRPGNSCTGVAGIKEKTGRKNPPQHIYHIIPHLSSQRQNGPGASKSVFRTKPDVCIWGTFHLEKLKNPCYLIVTKRRYLNSNSSGGLPKANGKYGNQSDFKSK